MLKNNELSLCHHGCREALSKLGPCSNVKPADNRHIIGIDGIIAIKSHNIKYLSIIRPCVLLDVKGSDGFSYLPNCCGWFGAFRLQDL